MSQLKNITKDELMSLIVENMIDEKDIDEIIEALELKNRLKRFMNLLEIDKDFKKDMCLPSKLKLNLHVVLTGDI